MASTYRMDKISNKKWVNFNLTWYPELGIQQIVKSMVACEFVKDILQLIFKTAALQHNIKV